MCNIIERLVRYLVNYISNFYKNQHKMVIFQAYTFRIHSLKLLPSNGVPFPNTMFWEKNVLTSIPFYVVIFLVHLFILFFVRHLKIIL
jgi:hypothetical protein